IEDFPAILVFMKQRATALVHHVNIAPMHDGHDHWVEVESSLRENVFIACRAFLIFRFPEHTETHELLQSLSQKMASDAEPRLEFLEAAYAKKAFAEN